MSHDLICWEAMDPTDDASLARARHLYETTQPPDERIPWEWINRAVARRHQWRPGGWSRHLLLAGPRPQPRAAPEVSGFACVLHVPDYGGYVSYVGVDPAARGRGVGARLLDLAVAVLKVDASCEGSELPFVVLESKPPAPGEDRSAWAAKLGLWRRAGVLWVSGLTLHATNYQDQTAPLRLALFLRPVARRAEDFDAEALRQVAAGLLGEIYDREPGDEAYERTLPAECRPELRPAEEAMGLTW